MSEHTPGPWAVNPFRTTVDACDDEGPLPICKLLWPTNRRSEDETEANARLIAAAPELLEALQELMDEQNGPPLIRDAPAWEAAMSKARAAIAKVEGRA